MVVLVAFFLVVAVVALSLLLLPTGKLPRPPPGPPKTKKTKQKTKQKNKKTVFRSGPAGRQPGRFSENPYRKPFIEI